MIHEYPEISHAFYRPWVRYGSFKYYFTLNFSKIITQTDVYD